MSTHRIPAANLDRLTTRIAQLAKRAAKLGVPAPTLTVGPAEVVEERDEYGHVEVHTWHEVEVTGDAPHLADWTLTAVIQRDPAEPDAANVVHVLDGDLDPAWRTVGDTCDHDACNGAARGRKTLVVVTHPTQGRKILGVTCVADYLGGVTPDQVAGCLSYIAAWAALDADLDDDDWAGPVAEYRLDLATVLAWTAAAIRTWGWVSRGQARDNWKAVATADDVARLIGDPKRRDGDPTITPADKADAAAALAWGRAADPAANDYLANVAAVAAKTSITLRDLGIACSFVAAAQRDAAQAAEKAARAAATADSAWFGTVGKRQVVTAEVTRTYTVGTDFGTATWVTAVTADGNVVKWKASGAAPERGDVITGKATVKAHDTWEGRQETVVTRWAWTVHPDHCRHTYSNAYGDLAVTAAGDPACARCGRAAAPGELAAWLDATGQVAFTRFPRSDRSRPMVISAAAAESLARHADERAALDAERAALAAELAARPVAC